MYVSKQYYDAQGYGQGRRSVSREKRGIHIASMAQLVLEMATGFPYFLGWATIGHGRTVELVKELVRAGLTVT